MKTWYLPALALGMMRLFVPVPVAAVDTTIYVGKHFEVREHEAPVKYVFNGSTRVARVTGSLSSNIRVQRFRLYAGWNLLSLAVSATNVADLLQQSGVITSARAWNPQAGDYSTVPQAAPAGTILWVHAATNTILAVAGAYLDPVNRQVAAGAAYLPCAGLEAWSPALPPSAAAWSFGPESSAVDSQPAWLARLTGDLSSVNELPRAFPPGQAFYVISPAPFVLEIPDPALRIRYYHQDHLGSSAVMSDANGALVEETAYYPFGIPRHEHRHRQIEEPYKFTQKERDRESGHHYFEARYLAGGMSRFLSVDPMYANTDASAGDPQAMNLYAYVRNNPLQYTDPTGLEPVPDLAAIAHNAAVSDTQAAGKSGAASYSAGLGDGLLDIFTPNPYIYQGLFGGTRLGPDIRGALGIDNVDSDSGSYFAGDLTSMIVSFATGAGEIRAAIKGGSTVAQTLSKGGSAGGGASKTLAGGWQAPVAGGAVARSTASGGAKAAVSEGGTLATGGRVKTWPGGENAPAKAWDGPGNAAASRKAAWKASLADPESAWWQGMVDAYRAKGALPNASNMSLIEKMTQVLFKPLGK